jgi:hypothetical protein
MKRGNIVLDITIFTIILFVTVLIFFVIGNFWSTINTDLLQDSEFDPNGSLDDAYTNMDSWIGSLGNIIIFLILGMVAFLLISAQFIETHPGFFIFGIFALILIVVLGAMLANTFIEFEEDSAFTEQAEDYAVAGWIIKYLPMFILLVGALVFIILYAKFT